VFKHLLPDLKIAMKKQLLAVAGFAIAFSFLHDSLCAQNVAINGTGAAPNASAMLDVASTTSGMLVPRMTTAQRTAIATPATGLYVYDTNLAAFLYFDGTAWRYMAQSGGWLLAGNALTGGEFMGSTTAQPVAFRANNVERMRIISAGTVVVGATAAVDPLDLFDAVGTAAMPYAVNGYANGAAAGVWGEANSATGFGMIAINGNANGTGILVTGNNSGLNYLIAGSGGAFNGSGTGVFAIAHTVASGTGVVASGNNAATTTLATGSGGAFRAVGTGVFAYSTTVGVGEAIYTQQFNNVVRVNYWSGTQQFKIAGTGVMPVACAVKDGQGVDRTMYCSESPEFFFEDYGQGQLVNGQAHINIDSLLAQYVIIDDKHPLRVYIQIEGDENCKGVVVKNKTGNGFDVVEMMGGTSNATFQWHIVCNVADVDLGNGRVSQLADSRFAPMGAPRTLVEGQTAVAPGKKAAAPAPGQPAPAQGQQVPEQKKR
jgi:hypothetical protein